jgi:hypothetical protein
VGVDCDTEKGGTRFLCGVLPVCVCVRVKSVHMNIITGLGGRYYTFSLTLV